jgi:ABC-2 type transport system permease protein
MYAAGIAVMFILFSANGAGASLLEEKEAGTLERLLTSRLNITQLMIGKWIYIALLGFLQLSIMFAWGQLVFDVDLTGHLPGFVMMGLATTSATASFALLLAAVCRSRNQLNGVSVVLVLSMSAVGGSMIPRYIMSESMQRLGRFTFNGWALDGFKKIFWYDLPVSAIKLELCVLCGIALLLGVAARFFAQRWSVA